MPELIEVVFHLRRECVCTNTETSPERQRVQGQTKLRIDLAAVDDRGQLTVDSETGRGSVFTVYLPLAEPYEGLDDIARKAG